MPRNILSGLVEFFSRACSTSGSDESVKNLDGSGLGENVPQPAINRVMTVILNTDLIERFIFPPAAPVCRRSEPWDFVPLNLLRDAVSAPPPRLLEGFCQARKIRPSPDR